VVVGQTFPSSWKKENKSNEGMRGQCRNNISEQDKEVTGTTSRDLYINESRKKIIKIL
jgi:hypothetical protein